MYYRDTEGPGIKQSLNLADPLAVQVWKLIVYEVHVSCQYSARALCDRASVDCSTILFVILYMSSAVTLTVVLVVHCSSGSRARREWWAGTAVLLTYIRMWTVCVHYVKTLCKRTLAVENSKKPKTHSSYGMAYTGDETALNSKCKPWVTDSRLHYSQARIPTSWWETVAHHDRTSLINRRTQHTSHKREQGLERILCTGYILQPSLRSNILVTWSLLLYMKLWGVRNVFWTDPFKFMCLL